MRVGEEGGLIGRTGTMCVEAQEGEEEELKHGNMGRAGRQKKACRLMTKLPTESVDQCCLLRVNRLRFHYLCRQAIPLANDSAGEEASGDASLHRPP